MSLQALGYPETLDHRLGVNVGTLIGHSAVRYYVMGDECQVRSATNREIEAMRDLIRQAITAGALGLSMSRVEGHYDPQGIPIPAVWAKEKELFALADVLKEMGTGVIQCGGGHDAEPRNRLMSRLSEATGRAVIYNALVQTVQRPNEWKQLMELVDHTTAAGIRAYPLCTPLSVLNRFTMRNCQTFRGVPSWHPILLASDAGKLSSYSDPEIRKTLHSEVINWSIDMPNVEAILPRNWYDYIWVQETTLKKTTD